MKTGKALGSSGIVVEMIRAASDTGASMICDLAAAIISDGKVPSYWAQSFIVRLYKGKGDAWERGNFLSLKLIESSWKSGEDCGLPHQTVGLNQWFPVWLCPRQRHNRCYLCIRQLQVTSLGANKRLHSFCRPGEGIWPNASKGHLVGAEKTWCGGVDCATGAGDVC